MITVTYIGEKIRDMIVLARLKKMLRQEAHLKLVYDRPFFFILSAGRSGSTLLRKLLMENAYVHIPPESEDLMVQVSTCYLKYLNMPWSTKVDHSVSVFEESGLNKYWNLSISNVKKRLLSYPEEYQSLRNLILSFFIEHAEINNAPGAMLGDKTPYLILRVNWIKLIFPQAKIIYIIRNGFDVVVSRMRSFQEDIGTASRRWVITMKIFLKNKKKLKAFEIRYEDLVHDDGRLMSGMLTFLGLEKLTTPRTIALGDDSLPHHKGLKQRINHDSIGKGKHDLSPDQYKYLEDTITRYNRLYYD